MNDIGKLPNGEARAFNGPRVWPGLPNPLGATRDGSGVNFALCDLVSHNEKHNLANGDLGVWEPLVDTTAEDGLPEGGPFPPGTVLQVGGRSLQVLRLTPEAG